MKNIYKYSAFLFVVLLVSAFAANAQSTNSTAKQETAPLVAPKEAFFNIESLDNLKTKTEEAYTKAQNAPADKAEVLTLEFRQLRRLYYAELERQASSYPSDSETGMKIRSELTRGSKDLR